MDQPVEVKKQSFTGVHLAEVDRVNGILARLGGFVRLKTEGPEIKPVWLPAPSSSYHNELNEHNSETSTKFWSDCFRISAAVLGSEVQPSKSWFDEHNWAEITERVFVQNKEVPITDCPLAGHLAGKCCYSVLKQYEPELKRLQAKFLDAKKAKETPKTTEQKTEGKDLTISAEMRALRSGLKPTKTVVRGGCVDGKATEPQELDQDLVKQWPDFIPLWELYCDLYQSHLQDFCSELQINESIRPQVGDTLIIVPAMAAAKKWCRWVIADGYNPNFHWAPVVFTTPEGYICLENFAVANPREINNKWEFRYYKYAEGGYHAKLMESGGYGNVAMTLVVRRLT